MTTYEATERNAFLKQIREIETSPLNKEAATEFDNILRTNVDLLIQRIDWLIQGCYGKGSYDATNEVLRNKRMNRHAWLFQTIAAIEFGVKASKARSLWNALDTDTQRHINHLLSLSISDAVRELANN